MPLLLTVEEAAEQLGIGRTKTFALISEGHIETVQIGRHRRVPSEALEAYVRRLRKEQAKRRPVAA
ncbi:excisionase family DNA-binding protein [Actinoplanes sp. CA-142083]|uniref:excisionase family DNA-binding protein n=1 Tax=Actinoplanes sp. CA-142083 TaxID=3239903 RepID=UPI003D89FA44